MSKPPSPSRRRFIQAGTGFAVAVPLRRVEARTTRLSQPARYEFFSAEEARFVEAALARLIPVDELGPGALEAGVQYFMDGQLGGTYGAGERLYQAGPWRKGTSTQGYQLPHTPAELFRAGVRAIGEHLAPKGGFAKLAPHEQDAFLDALQKGEIDLGAAGTSEFFELLLALTIEGYLGDPVYGGNRGMAAWKMIGFPGAYASYYDLVGENVAFDAEPMSLAEGAHAHGHKP